MPRKKLPATPNPVRFGVLECAVIVVAALTAVGPFFYDVTDIPVYAHMPVDSNVDEPTVVDPPRSFVDVHPWSVSWFALLSAAAVLLPLLPLPAQRVKKAESRGRVSRIMAHLIAAVLAMVLFCTAWVPALAAAEVGTLALVLALTCWTAVLTLWVRARLPHPADSRTTRVTAIRVTAIVVRVTVAIALAAPYTVVLLMNWQAATEVWELMLLISIACYLPCILFACGVRWMYLVIASIGVTVMLIALLVDSQTLLVDRWDTLAFQRWVAGGCLVALGTCSWELSRRRDIPASTDIPTTHR